MNVESSLCVEDKLFDFSYLVVRGPRRVRVPAHNNVAAATISGESRARLLPRAKGQARARRHPRRLHRKPHVAQVWRAILSQDEAIARRSWRTVRVAVAAAPALHARRGISVRFTRPFRHQLAHVKNFATGYCR